MILIGFTLAILLMIKKKDLELNSILIKHNTEDSTRMIKEKVKDVLNGQMLNNMMDNG